MTSVSVAQTNNEQIQSIRYANGLARDFVPYLEEIDDLYTKMLNKRSNTKRPTMSDIEFSNSLEKATKDIVKEWNVVLEKDLKLYAGEAAESAASSVTVVEPKFNPKVPSANQVYTAALQRPMSIGVEGTDLFMKDMFEGFDSKIAKAASNQVRSGFINGSTTQEMTRNLKSVLNRSYGQTKTVVRTAVNSISAQSRDLVFKENDDIIIGQQFVATLDSRTSQVCRSLDGNEYFYADNPDIPSLPIHYNERSSYAPILIGDDFTDGKRASKGAESADSEDGYDPKQVSSQQTYYDFLQKQPAWYIDEAMGGATEGKMFRKLVKTGDMTTDEFAKMSINSTTLQPLTLDEMAAKNKEVNNYLKSIEDKT